ncbi:flagellar brake protein [Ammoniphilus sp. CFH 90114]|uniref:flagellar brake protein n=1 Tax=Ammoniphilus sp. CFH 90114 TaxID=2493665 RepID=UPI0013E96FDC|nr:flagellar brake domain-containing protein [Ammoniphilus sp. CFH 90114]
MIPGISQLLRVSLRTKDTVESQDTYKSRVDNVLDQSLLIEVPLSEKNGKSMAYSAGIEITVFYFGLDGSKYIFPSRVLSRKNEDVPLWEIALPRLEDIERIQRRNYLRIPAMLELSLKSLTRGIQFLARTVDVSGGGVAFTCKKEYRMVQGERFQCWLAIPFRQGMEHAPFIAKVVRIVPPKEDMDHQTIMLMISVIKEPEREKIIRYCFERQLELRKKGVL